MSSPPKSKKVYKAYKEKMLLFCLKALMAFKTTSNNHTGTKEISMTTTNQERKIWLKYPTSDSPSKETIED